LSIDLIQVKRCLHEPFRSRGVLALQKLAQDRGTICRRTPCLSFNHPNIRYQYTTDRLTGRHTTIAMDYDF
jgi:hypothetical protein